MINSSCSLDKGASFYRSDNFISLLFFCQFQFLNKKDMNEKFLLQPTYLYGYLIMDIVHKQEYNHIE